MKNKVLIIFKYPRDQWNTPIINKFSNFYDIEYLYISDYKNKNFTEIVNEINSLIKVKNIEIAVFDVDYFKFINFFFIQRINANKKILISGDFDHLEMHLITANACDLVLSGCPFSVLKYREKGYEAHWMHFESGKINNNVDEKKEFDVLFFGSLIPVRKEFLDYIVKQGINLKNVGYHEHSTDQLPIEELTRLISKSKIVLSFSKSRTTSVMNYSSERVFKFFYQFTGKIVMAGMNGAVCVSEYSPALELIFKENEVPTFYTKEECVKILKELLGDNELLTRYKNKFISRAHNVFEDKKIFEPIINSVKKTNNRKVSLFKMPYWYLRIAAKQILLRNIKISNLIKTIFQLSIIFKIIKNSNFLVKLLIIVESILNILWYSFTQSFKFRKF